MKAHQLGTYLSGQNIDHVIFDFDQTIATIKIDWQKWNIEAMKIVNKFEPDFAKQLAFVNAQAENELIKRHGDKFLKQFSDFSGKFEMENMTGIDVNPKAILAINSISSQKIHIWSSNSKATLKKLLKELNLHSRVSTVVSRDEVTYKKPHPHGFDFIYDQVTPREKYLMIGDSWKDEHAAKAAGIKFMHVDKLE